MKKRVDISLIEENPLSKKFFDDLPDEEFEFLKQDIEDRDIQIPIEVVEVGEHYMLVTGHQRLRAKKALGAKEIEVSVREDLKTEEEIELHLIKDNLLRRHLSREQMIMLTAYLMEKYGGLRGRPRKKGQKFPFSEGKGKTRDKVADLLGISARSADKYYKISKLPEEERDNAIKKKKKMRDVLSTAVDKGFASSDVAEEDVVEAEMEAEMESSPEEGSERKFDPMGELEGESDRRCVRCGRTAFTSEAEGDEADPRWFAARLVREFVKSGRRELCDGCLSFLYKNLGFTVQRNWEKFLSEKTDLQPLF